MPLTRSSLAVCFATVILGAAVAHSQGRARPVAPHIAGDTGDAEAVPRAIAPRFRLVDIERDRWPEPNLHTAAMSDLAAYVRRRAAQHEYTQWQSIRFDGWRGNELRFSDVDYLRRADDLKDVQKWRARGAYVCRQGIIELISRRL